MAKSWKYYRAEAEQYRERNVFQGPLRTEMVDSKDADPDEFVHYHREGRLGNGTDYFGVRTIRHRTWQNAQPAKLEVTEIAASEIPTDNKHTALAQTRLDAATTDAERAKAEEAFAGELGRKGLPVPDNAKKEDSTTT